MSARSIARRLIIDGTTLVGLDALSRRRLAEGGRGVGATGRCVRVALGHATPKSGADAFRRQLAWASEHFELIGFDRFKALCADPSASLKKPGLMFTFDDGLLSNFEIGAGILEEFGVRGVFFVVPGFSELADSGGAGGGAGGGQAAARAYFRDRIRGDASIDDLPMSPAHIKELADRGHTIGNHTLTHTRLSETPEDQLHAEILSSAEKLEAWIGRPVETFAWTFAWDAISASAYALIRERHPYCFSPCPGLVHAAAHTPALIWRTNIEAFADLRLARFMLSGLGDPAWAARRARLAEMLGQPRPGRAG